MASPCVLTLVEFVITVMATHSEINPRKLVLFWEQQISQKIHKYHLQCVQHKENAALYGGVRGTSSFALGYFDVTKSLLPDIMHDMLMGVFPLTMKHVI